MSNTFDTVVSFNILKFTHYLDWPKIKPFLISQTFRLVFESEEFAKQYLSVIFSLSEEELNRLIEFGLAYGKNWGVDREKDSDETPKKKRKKELNNDQYVPPRTLNEILRMYTKLSLKLNIDKKKTQIINTVISYERGQLDSKGKISDINKYVAMLELDALLIQTFKRFTNESRYIETEKNEIKINQSTMMEIFGNVKEIFILDHGEEEEGINVITKSESVIFTAIGYPLLMKSVFTNGGLALFELLSLYSHMLFSNSSEGMTRYNQELLDSLQKILLSKNVDEILLRANVDENQLTYTKQFLIYEYVQNSFGTFNSSFRLDSEDWLPFVGTVRKSKFQESEESDSDSDW